MRELRLAQRASPITNSAKRVDFTSRIKYN